MAGFKDLGDLLSEFIELPINSKIYRIDSPSAEAGLRIQSVTNVAAKLVNGGASEDTEVLDDDEELDLLVMCLGSAYDDMIADKVSWTQLRHAAMTALVWISYGTDTAEKYWASAGRPEALAPNREARRAAGSAAAKSTPQRGSTSGTNHRQGGSRRRQGTKT